MARSYVSRYAHEYNEGSLVCEPIKIKRSQAQIPVLQDHRCVGIYNASKTDCHLTLNLVNGKSTRAIASYKK